MRPLDHADIAHWIALRSELWPEQSAGELDTEGRAALIADPPLIVFVAEVDGALAGFIEFGLRSVAEGCAGSPAPYIEGWYVRQNARRRGMGAALVRAVEAWCRQRGYLELGSDTHVDNRLGRSAHAALGFGEVETLVVFRKLL